MHIKTNIEMTFIHFVVLAICPFLLVIQNASDALYYIAAVSVCFLLCAFICFVFNRYFSKMVKVFVTAVLSTFLITIFNYYVDANNLFGLTITNQGSLAIISTMILSADIIYVENQASSNFYFLKILRTAFVFALLMIIYSVVKEFLAYGTLFLKKISAYSGLSFFRRITFNLVWLGVICAFAEIISRAISKKIENRAIEYQKIVKKIRDEKAFQYDNLRRQKLLASNVETNRIDGDKVEEIIEKESENEIVAPEEIVNETESLKEPPKKKKKKNKKLKVSKAAKVEKVFDRQTDEEDVK